MTPIQVLRIEGSLVLIAAVWGYVLLGASWGLFAILFLVPDLFMAGYLVGARVGAAVYNVGHTYAGPFLFGAAALGSGDGLFGALALIWAAHIGIDRALGYGLKQTSGFRDTHLSPPPESPTSTEGDGRERQHSGPVSGKASEWYRRSDDCSPLSRWERPTV